MKKSALLALGLCLLGSSAHAFVVTFDNSTDYNLFTEGTISAGTNGSYSTADGVGTPDGAVLVSSSTDQFNYNAASFNIGNGSSWTVSAYVNGYTLVSEKTGSSLLGIGFVRDASDNFAITNTASTGVYARISNLAGASDPAGVYNVNMVNKTADNLDGVIQSPTSGTFNLTTNNWYKFTLTLTATAANTFSYLISLQDYGADGVSAPSNVISNLSGSFTNSAVYGDTTMHAGFVSRPFNGSPTPLGYVDNFEVSEVIPEPSSALFALLGIGAFFTKRRR